MDCCVQGQGQSKGSELSLIFVCLIFFCTTDLLAVRVGVCVCTVITNNQTKYNKMECADNDTVTQYHKAHNGMGIFCHER